MEPTQRQVRLFIAMSLDGYIARPDGSIDWLLCDQDYGYTGFYQEIDTVLMGRHTWEQLKTFGDYPYAGKRGVVFSRNLSGETSDKVEFVTEAIDVWLTEARREEGGDFWLVGGAHLVDGCLRHDLIDEIVLSIHPVLLGCGVPLFRPQQSELALELVDSQTYATGLVQLTYRRIR